LATSKPRGLGDGSFELQRIRPRVHERFEVRPNQLVRNGVRELQSVGLERALKGQDQLLSRHKKAGSEVVGLPFQRIGLFTRLSQAWAGSLAMMMQTWMQLEMP
jgi:hypothetical protein